MMMCESIAGNGFEDVDEAEATARRRSNCLTVYYYERVRMGKRRGLYSLIETRTRARKS